MATVTVENPKYSGEKNVDSNGRVYLGEEYAGESIKMIIEEVVDE